MSVAALWAGTTTLAAPALRMLLLVRARRGKEVRERLGERRGIEESERPPGLLIWLHAASVGETVSVLPLLAALADQRPAAKLLLTTGTVGSTRLLALRLPGTALNDRLIHRFAPLDVPSWVRRFLRHWHPDVAGFVESELWPNLVGECYARSIPTMLINGRLSPRSFARWRRFPGTAGGLLRRFTRIEAQSAADAKRFLALGARSVSVPGNLKFSAPPLPFDEWELQRLQALIGDRPVWLAASTHAGEEALVLAAHDLLAAKRPGLLTVLAPRHPDRGAAVLAKTATINATRRSVGDDPPSEGGIWIADTLGELGLFYRLARIALVGRSLVPPGGGQNPLEGARLGCAVAVGPHTANFTDIVEFMRNRGALAQVADAGELAAWIGTMLDDPAARDAAGQAGVASAARFGDLPQRTAATLLSLVAPPPNSDTP